MFAEETKEVKLYSYNDKGVFNGEFQYLWVVGTGIASNSTLETPLKEKDGFVSAWNGSKWEYKENHIGKTAYNTETKESKVIDCIGEIQQGWTLLEPIEFGAWNGTDWVDPRTEEEKLTYKRSQYPKLTRYQFMRGMLENGYKSSDIEAKILLIEDEYTRELTMLGFKDAGYFDRNDQSIGVMRDVLGKTDLEIDEFWEECLSF